LRPSRRLRTTDRAGSAAIDVHKLDGEQISRRLSARQLLKVPETSRKRTIIAACGL
jgi:hypothetical protein